MTPVLSSTGLYQYNIVVRSDTGEECVYRTSRLLFDGGSDDVLSKGTRVWEALRVDSESGETMGQPVVVKDSWVWRHREREGSILARIRDSASVLSESEREHLQDSLVTVVHHGDVRIHGESDCTRSTSWEATRSLNNDTQSHLQFDAPVVQIHYRAVYKEVCRPLRTEACLATVFASVAEICSGMSVLSLPNDSLTRTTP